MLLTHHSILDWWLKSLNSWTWLGLWAPPAQRSIVWYSYFVIAFIWFPSFLTLWTRDHAWVGWCQVSSITHCIFSTALHKLPVCSLREPHLAGITPKVISTISTSPVLPGPAFNPWTVWAPFDTAGNKGLRGFSTLLCLLLKIPFPSQQIYMVLYKPRIRSLPCPNAIEFLSEHVPQWHIDSLCLNCQSITITQRH